MSAPAASPRIAVVGRQNVGKSTLANRLFGRREAIAHDMPGVTRDRVELEAVWRGKRFGLVDTAGYVQDATGVEELARVQADTAMRDADLILLIVDAQAGITEADAALARRLRRASVPVLVVANKVDGAAEESDAAAFHALGLGEPVAVSGMHGRATGDLLDRIVELLPDAPEVREDDDLEPRFALVGRPNVGKSSLFNRLLGQERSVVFEEAGTTRDSVDDVIEWPTGRVRFVDTAGMRRQVKVKGVEYFSFVRATEAIDRANVVILVIDAVEGFTVEDKKIANRVMDAGRAFVLVANKWDLVEDKDDSLPGARRDGEAVRERDGDASISQDRTWRAPSATGPARPPRAVDVQDLDLEDQRRDPAGATRATHPARRRHPPLRDAGRHRTTVVRDLRWCQRTGRHLSALPREPPAPNLRSRWCSDPPEVPATQATQQAALRRPSVRPVQSPLRAVAQLG